MSKLRVFCVGILLALFFSAIPFALGQDGDQIAPPRVIETSPLVGEELALDSSVQFIFDRPMDSQAPDTQLSLDPALAGEWTWGDDGQTLSFSLSTGTYERATTYRFSVFAVDATGQAMAEPYILELESIGNIEVADVLPAVDSTEIDVASPITIIFNRPIVPLTGISEQADFLDPIDISPPTTGKGEWLNTSIYVFQPDTVLAGGSRYTVTVKADLEGLDGAILPDDYRFSFSTANPSVLQIVPKDRLNAVPIDTPITVSFSQPINPSTQHGIRLEGPNGSLPELDYTWDNTGKTVVIKPRELLQLDTIYDIIVDRNVIRTPSNATLEENYRQSFETVPYPRILRSVPASGSVNVNPFEGFRVYFSAPIDQSTLVDKFIIGPEPSQIWDSYYYSYDDSYMLYFSMQPSTTYSITILPGIADPYGNIIDTETQINFTTSPYTPDLALSTPDSIGFYNAYNPLTQLFVSHLNISSLDFQLYRLDNGTLAKFTGPDGYWLRDAFFPASTQLIRAWSMPVESVLNDWRYELVNISPTGPSGLENIQCIGAAIPRLSVGNYAQVGFSDTRPSRVRSEPSLTGEVIASYASGTQFLVNGNPICADGYLWWPISEEASALNGWIAEGSGSTYFIEPVGDTPPSSSVNNDELSALAPGVYFLNVNSPETRQQNDSRRKHVMVLGTVNLSMKNSPKQALVWVTDMQSAAPVGGVSVSLYNQNFELLGTASTDADGLATFTHAERQSSLYNTQFAIVDDGTHYGFVASDFSEGIEPWYFDIYGNYQPEAYNGYLYTDRPIYRPDQPVYYRGILRNQDDAVYTPVSTVESVYVKIYNDQSAIIYEEQVPLTPYGTFSGELMLDTEAGLGYYRIEAALSPEESATNYRFSVGFNVAEYRAPEFQVSLSNAADEVVQGDTIQVEVESRYYFGGAVSNAKVTWAIVSDNYYFNYRSDRYWQFFDYNYDNNFSAYYGSNREEVARGEGLTDAEGNFTIELPADLGTKTLSQTYTIEAVISDESNQIVAGRSSLIVHQGLVYVGISPDEYIATAGTESSFSLLTVDWDGQAVAEQSIDYRVVERRWSSVQEKNESGRSVWIYEVEEIEVANGSATTDADGLAQVKFTPPNGGVFKIYGSTHDERGNLIQSSAFLWVSSRDYVAWRQQNSNRIDLITDADTYSVGDTAEILIASPFQGNSYALITVERGDILQKEVVALDSNSYIYQLPIQDIHAPNIFVSVVLIKGVDANTPYTQFRVGLTQLNVDTSKLLMNVDVTPDIPEGTTLGPGDSVDLHIKTTDSDGNPVSAEVGIGVTDVAVLSIAPANSGTLLDKFYGLQGVSVRTSVTLTNSVDQITQTIIDTVKGGGGGGEEGGIFDVRQEFVDTPLWEPDVVTDANGEATVTITLPDNLTTWRIDARAITTGNEGRMLVGQSTGDFISTKPLLIRPITPRFAVVDDIVTLGAIVNNNTDSPQEVEILIQGTGFTILDGGDLQQNATIPARGRMRVNWRVQVLDVENIDVFFAVQNSDASLQDASKPPLGLGDEQLLPVYRYTVPEIVGTAGVLEGPDATSYTEIINLPDRIDESQGTLNIRLDRSLAASMLDSLEVLRLSPYVTTENTVSRLLPNAIMLAALQRLEQSDPELERQLSGEIGLAVQRLTALQKVDGGWGWMPSDTSNTLTSAYALIGLVEAQNSGFRVDADMLQRAVSFLNSYLLDTDNATSLNTSDSATLNRRAFVLYALARSGNGNASRLTSLFEVRERLNLDAKAYLALSMQLLDPNDSRLASLMSDFANAATLSATGTHWEDRPDWQNWTTDTRSSALVLMAMSNQDISNALLPGAVRWLMIARQADAWETSQETAWAVMALTNWMLATDELAAAYEFNVRLNGDLLAIDDNSANAANIKESLSLRVEVADLLQSELNRLTLIKGDGAGNLYYTAHLESYRDVASVEPVSRGLIINRQYYLADDPERSPITRAQVGDTVIVKLTIIAPRNLHYVVIEDAFPAGAEAVDSRLLTESIFNQAPNLSRHDPLGDNWGWHWFSQTDFYDEKAIMYANYLPRGTYTYTYVLRLGLAGEYQVIPTTGREFYFPEVYGRGAGALFVIEPAAEDETVLNQ